MIEALNTTLKPGSPAQNPASLLMVMSWISIPRRMKERLLFYRLTT